MTTDERLRLLKCLADDTRLQILDALKNGERCVCEIMKDLNKEQSLLSHHLQTLRRCKLVKFRWDGKKKMYRLAEPSVLKLLTDLEKLSKKSC
jgi:ArsR family transcriptional regulator